ncbi:MAG: hypothetical protein R3224_05275 [Balneolaceae bacterium]|nr:hypothetical protein [Balneolaceae bacterium]
MFFGLTALDAVAQDTYEEWKKQQMQEFKEFQDARDKEFLKMLDDTWKAINSMKAGDLYEEPKPDRLPKVETPTVPQPRAGDEPVIEDIEIPDIDSEPDFGQQIELPKRPTVIRGYTESELDFYGVPVSYSYPKSIDTSLGFKIEKEKISEFWGELGSANYNPMLKQSQEIKERLALNDWGYALILYRMGQDIYGRRSNESVLFTWFMMTKAGYRVKVGYDQEGVYLLVPTASELYNTRFFRIDGIKHYGLTLDNTGSVPSSIFTYDGSYPNADKKMDLNIDAAPKVTQNTINKNFQFTYGEETFEVPVRVNRNVIAFYELYPLTELDVYFGASMSPEVKSSLLKGLAPLIKGKSETEAVNMLLRFVQTAFQYQTDQQQFGKEKYLLPAETLFYPYSDCDDRTIMFATLVRELVGLDVIGVHYPGHLATAVRFSNAPDGDFVMAKGAKYTIADPTYENANIGMTMPQYRNQEPELLGLK